MDGKKWISCRFCFSAQLQEHASAAHAKLDDLKDLWVESEIDPAEFECRKQEIEVAMREVQKRLQNAPADVKDLEELLAKVDRIAEIIQAGSPERKKELFNTLFMRIEERDGHITAVLPHNWARPFFNGEDCSNG